MSQSDPARTVAFQGIAGAYSHIASQAVFPEFDVLPCPSFEDVFDAVEGGRARYAMLPVENSVAGRVTDNHHLLPGSPLHIIGEHYERIHHQLLGVPGTTLDTVSEVRSHVQALGQCRKFLRARGWTGTSSGDTAGSARRVAELNDPKVAAIASELAGQVYGLETLLPNIEDEDHNTTRFLIMCPEPRTPEPGNGPCVTTMIFRTSNRPAALYKALGGFATNGLNMTKLESYMVDGHFTATQFYLDVEGHPEDRLMKLAIEELAFFSKEMRIVGVYPAHSYRLEQAGKN